MRIKELIYDPQWAFPEGSKDQKLPKKSKILIFLVADMQLYKRLCQSVGLSVGLSGVIKFKSGKTSIFDTFCLCLIVGGVKVWMGVGCPCPPVRNDIVTPRHLFGVIT